MSLRQKTTEIKEIGILRSYFKIMSSHQSEPLSEATCLLPICVGQEYHYADNLQAIIDSLQRAKRIIVIISGCLYRHTHQINNLITPEEAFYNTIQEGKIWLQQHKSIIESSLVPVTVYTWERWLLHPNYKDFRRKVDKLYQIDPEFKQAFDSTAHEFLERIALKTKIDDYDRSLTLSLYYLKEECAIFATMYYSDKFTYFVYPGSYSVAIAITLERLISQPISWARPMFKIVKTSNIEYEDAGVIQSEIKMSNILAIDSAFEVF